MLCRASSLELFDDPHQGSGTDRRTTAPGPVRGAPPAPQRSRQVSCSTSGTASLVLPVEQVRRGLRGTDLRCRCRCRWGRGRRGLSVRWTPSLGGQDVGLPPPGASSRPILATRRPPPAARRRTVTETAARTVACTPVPALLWTYRRPPVVALHPESDRRSPHGTACAGERTRPARSRPPRSSCSRGAGSCVLASTPACRGLSCSRALHPVARDLWKEGHGESREGGRRRGDRGHVP